MQRMSVVVGFVMVVGIRVQVTIRVDLTGRGLLLEVSWLGS